MDYRRVLLNFLGEQYLNSSPKDLYRTQHLKYRATLLKSSVTNVDVLLPAYANEFFAPTTPVTRANSVTGPGIGALFASLVWALTDVGQGVLLSSPYYDGEVLNSFFLGANLICWQTIRGILPTLPKLASSLRTFLPLSTLSHPRSFPTCAIG